jgi:endonuclease YncB( thermonuclease family)
LIAGKCITLKRKGKDKYHRTIGELYLPDGTWINEEMVLSGNAWSYMDQLISDQHKAERERLGMWKYAGNIPPYIFRKEHKH